jgi:hypothetical protein
VKIYLEYLFFVIPWNKNCISLDLEVNYCAIVPLQKKKQCVYTARYMPLLTVPWVLLLLGDEENENHTPLQNTTIARNRQKGILIIN